MVLEEEERFDMLEPANKAACATEWQCPYVHQGQAVYDTVKDPRMVSLQEKRTHGVISTYQY